jgi:hypothetical protein
MWSVGCTPVTMRSGSDVDEARPPLAEMCRWPSATSNYDLKFRYRPLSPCRLRISTARPGANPYPPASVTCRRPPDRCPTDASRAVDGSVFQQCLHHCAKYAHGNAAQPRPRLKSPTPADRAGTSASKTTVSAELVMPGPTVPPSPHLRQAEGCLSCLWLPAWLSLLLVYPDKIKELTGEATERAPCGPCPRPGIPCASFILVQLILGPPAARSWRPKPASALLMFTVLRMPHPRVTAAEPASGASPRSLS